LVGLVVRLIVRRWLENIPARDDPQHFPPAPELSWDEWAEAGRAIPGLEGELTTLLADDPDEFTRGQAAIALGFVGGDASVAPLVAALQHDLPAVAMEAAAALGRLGRAEAVQPLRGALEHPDANVRASAATALDALG
jgi:hypothetical protein